MTTKPCPSKGCKNRMDAGASVCRRCFVKARQHKLASREKRLAEGRPTDEDLLRDENTEMRTRLKSLESVVSTYRNQARIEDRIVEDIRQLFEYNPYRPQLDLKATRIPSSAKKATPHEMLLLLSDAHYPERVDPAAAFGVSYGGATCMNRMSYITRKTLRFAELHSSAYPIRKLTVAVNGDMLSGNIHDELEVTNEKPIGEALVEMGSALIDMGSAFAQRFEEVEFVVMPGNHPRLEKKPRMKNAWNNWEYVLGHYVKAAVKDLFTVTVPKDLVYVHQVFNKRIGITHGDGVKSNSFAGIPFYGMKQRRDAIQALLKDLGQPQIDMLCYGHFHQAIFEEGSGCSLVINGSIKGYDEYIIKTKYSGQRPLQLLLTFHERHGLTDINRINLGHIQ